MQTATQTLVTTLIENRLAGEIDNGQAVTLIETFAANANETADGIDDAIQSFEYHLPAEMK